MTGAPPMKSEATPGRDQLLVDPAMTDIAERAAKQIARAERLDNVSAKEVYRTIIEAIVSARLAAKPDDDGEAVEPEELENLISDRSANRAADLILANYVVTRRSTTTEPKQQGQEGVGT